MQPLSLYAAMLPLTKWDQIRQAEAAQATASEGQHGMARYGEEQTQVCSSFWVSLSLLAVPPAGVPPSAQW
jgi:hypothetical protein